MKRISARQFLVEVRELIKSRSHWCKGAWAKTSKGNGVQADDPDACRWCLGGAMQYVCGQHPIFDSIKAYDKVRSVIKHSGIACFNDSHTHKEVIEVLDTAINSLTRRKK